MGKCFEGAFDAQAAQMLKFGLPRLVDYQQQDMIKGSAISNSSMG